MRELTIPALQTNLDEVFAFMEPDLKEGNCPDDIRIQLQISVEEIFVNIAHYAYAPKTGDAKITCELLKEDGKASLKMSFADRGKPYNPLEREDPDITLSAEERQIGGLGVWLVKEYMDATHYEYRDGQNVFTIVKKLP